VNPSGFSEENDLAPRIDNKRLPEEIRPAFPPEDRRRAAAKAKKEAAREGGFCE
jgi:hypothetical protein